MDFIWFYIIPVIYHECCILWDLKVALHGALYTEVVWALFNIMVLALFIAMVLHMYSSVGECAGCIAGCIAGLGLCSVPMVRMSALMPLHCQCKQYRIIATVNKAYTTSVYGAPCKSTFRNLTLLLILIMIDMAVYVRNVLIQPKLYPYLIL